MSARPGEAVSAAGPESRVGLALSGGGHRAAFFHLGALARLAELDRLRNIRVISTVSGGSIVGALYYMHVKALLEAFTDEELEAEGQALFTEAVRSVLDLYVKAAGRNLRSWALLDYYRDLQLARLAYSRTTRMAELYDAWIYRPMHYDREKEAFVQQDGTVSMSELLIHPLTADGGRQQDFNATSDANARRAVPVPILLINATTLNTGHAFRFDARGAGEPVMADALQESVNTNVRLCRTRYEEMPRGRSRYTVGTAVAASAAFPGGFAPLVLDGLYRVEGQRYSVRLTDGGVHDNQGVDGLLDWDCKRLLVSDGSGQMEDRPRPNGTVPGVVVRAGSIANTSAREQRLLRAGAGAETELMHLRQGLPVDAVGAGTSPPPEPEDLASTGVEPRVQRAIAHMRTDLDAFSDIEAAAVMGVGYRVAGASLGALQSPSGWWFEGIDPLLCAPPEAGDPAFLRRMHISSQRFLKPVFLLLALITRADRRMSGMSAPEAGPRASAWRVLKGVLAAIGLILALLVVVAVFGALERHSVPANALLGSLLGAVVILGLYFRNRGFLTRAICESLIPFVLALFGVFSIMSALLLADGGIHKGLGRATDRDVGHMLRDLGRWIGVATLAVILAAGVAATGVGLIAFALDALVDTPDWWSDLVVFDHASTTLLIGALAAAASGLALSMLRHAVALRNALAVGVGISFTFLVTLGIAALFDAIRSPLDLQGGVPPHSLAAWAEMLAVPFAVAGIVYLAMRSTLVRIGRWRDLETTLAPIAIALTTSLLLAILVLVTHN